MAYSSSQASGLADIERNLSSTFASHVRQDGMLPGRPVRSNIYPGKDASASCRPPIQYTESRRIPRPFYDKFLRLSADLPPSKRLRLHIDCNPEENALIYPYFNGTLLDLIRDDPGLRSTPRVKILRHVAEAIQELHAKDWIHIDVKPDNILVNWTSDAQNNKTVTDAVLGDFDVAHKLAPGDSRQTPYAIGNVMWRSPEGQTGRGVTKASDIFSFGLVCIYTLGGGELLLLNDYEALEAAGIMPEHEILTRHFAYFGPAPPGLLDQNSPRIQLERHGEAFSFFNCEFTCIMLSTWKTPTWMP
ncbi:Serine/threonine-protein kinase ppk4 like [Verticillium longisporum]|nr:Serine/threonine-protein kinase ppk4 like [Verticillium longisporum]KAG7134656.1 Serine/threonine-protein kinase ppk4 like [Verticillium longisporum]